jgi:hypothetical protein
MNITLTKPTPQTTKVALDHEMLHYNHLLAMGVDLIIKHKSWGQLLNECPGNLVSDLTNDLEQIEQTIKMFG